MMATTALKMCSRQIEFAGILKRAKNLDLAEKWIDFMLSVPYQVDLPLNQFVYPVISQAKLPDAFVKWSSVAQEPANLAPDVIARNHLSTPSAALNPRRRNAAQVVVDASISYLPLLVEER